MLMSRRGNSCRPPSTSAVKSRAASPGCEAEWTTGTSPNASAASAPQRAKRQATPADQVSSSPTSMSARGRASPAATSCGSATMVSRRTTAPRLIATVIGPRVTSAINSGRKVTPPSPRNALSSPNGRVAIAASASPKLGVRNRRALSATRASSGEASGGGALV